MFNLVFDKKVKPMLIEFHELKDGQWFIGEDEAGDLHNSTNWRMKVDEYAENNTADINGNIYYFEDGDLVQPIILDISRVRPLDI